MRTMAMMLDPDGLPRAWAIASDQGVAEREALKQLEAYRAKKREVGDPLAHAEFTLKIEKVA